MNLSRESISDRIREIKALPLAEAKAAAERLLADPTLFAVRKSPAGGDTDLSVLSPLLREFFSQFESVEAQRGDLRLDRRALRPSRLDSRYITLGSDIETEIAAMPGRDAVYQLDGFEPPVFESEPSPSIYHYIVMMTFP